MSYQSHKQSLVALIRQAADRTRPSAVFRHFVECAAIELSNVAQCDQDRVDRYRQIMGGYTDDERPLFGQMFAHLTLALEDRLGDVLGEIYMEMGLGNTDRGQFFTPYDLCRMMAKLNSGIGEKVANRGFVTVNDPACGAGAMPVAFADHMRSEGFNFQQQLHVVVTDIDIQAVHMCFVQLAIIGVPGVVVHGNSLTLEEYSQWLTPFHHWGGWAHRLQREALAQQVEQTTGVVNG